MAFMRAIVSSSYTVTVTDASGCSATSVAAVVTVNPPPIATITPSGPLTFCEGGNVTLAASAGASYLWSPGNAASASIVASASGSYTVTVTDAKGGRASCRERGEISEVAVSLKKK